MPRFYSLAKTAPIILISLCLAAFGGGCSVNLRHVVSAADTVATIAQPSPTPSASSATAIQLTGPTAIVASTCSTAFTASTVDSGNVAATVSQALSVALGGGGAGTFYSDSGCTQSVSSVIIPAGASSQVFYFKDTTIQNLALSGASTSLTTASFSVNILASLPDSAHSMIAVGASTVTTDGGTTTSVTITLHDSSNLPVVGASVTFAATGTGNTLVQPAGVTDALGQASGTIRSTKAETKTLSISSPSGLTSDTTTVTFTAGAVDAAHCSLAASGSPVTTDSGTTSTVTFTIADVNGNPISGVTPQFASTGTANTLVQPAAATNASGQTTGTIASTKAETKTLDISAPGGLTGVTTSVVFAAGAADAAHCSLAASGSPVANDGTTSTVTFTLADVHGNFIAGVTPQLASTGSTNTIVQPSSVTNASGQTTGTIASTTAETKTLDISSPAGLTGVTTTVTFAAPTPPSLSYAGPISVNKSVAVGTVTPTNTGGAINTCSASPTLPTGLSISGTTCAISGTPSVATATTTYTITANASTGTQATTTIVITVKDTVQATALSYKDPVVYIQGTAITTNTPSNSGGLIAAYSSAPGMPAGLTLDPISGQITGTPTGSQASTSYLITGANGNATPATFTIHIAVLATGATPTLSALSPKGGAIGGGTTITVTGTNLDTYATVTVGGNACGTVTVNAGGTSLTCVTSASTAGGLAPVAITASNTNVLPTATTANAYFMYGKHGAPSFIGGLASGWAWAPTGISATLGAGFAGGATSMGSPLKPVYSYDSAHSHAYFYVSDYSEARIQKFDGTTGAEVGWIGNVATRPTGGAAGCTTAATNSFTPGWCTGGSSQFVYSYSDGSLSGAGGIALDSTGANLYVIDSNNSRVVKYNSYTGAMIGWIGGVTTTGGTCSGTSTATTGFCSGGTETGGIGNAMFSAPTDLTIDSSDHYLYVADAGSARIQRFDLTSNGIFAGWIGRILSNAGLSCITAGCSTTNGTFTNGWVTGGTSRFDASSTGDGMFGNGGGAGGTAGMFLHASASYLYATDYYSHRIQRFNLNGTFAGWSGNIGTTAGLSCITAGCTTTPAGSPTNGWVTGGTATSGASDGQLNTPSGITTDGSYLYIADYGNARLVRMNLDGSISSWLGVINSPGGTCSNASGTYSGGWCNGAGVATPGGFSTGIPSSYDGGFTNPSGVTYDSTNNRLYIADSAASRVVKFTPTGVYGGWLQDAPSISLGWNSSGLPTFGTGDGMFSTTTGSISGDIAADFSGGYIYVADAFAGRIQRFDLTTGAFKGWIGYQYKAATGCVAGTCSLAANTFTGGWVSGGLPLTTSTGGDGAFQYPTGIAVSPDGTTLFVADNTLHNVQRFDAATGAFKGWIGYQNTVYSSCQAGSTCTSGVNKFTGGWANGGTSKSSPAKSGGLNAPSRIVADATYIYVTDDSNFRAVRYSWADGAFKGWIGKASTAGTCAVTANITTAWCQDVTAVAGTSTAVGGYSTPHGIRLDSQGKLWIADAKRFQRVNATTVGTAVSFNDVSVGSTVGFTVDPAGYFAIAMEEFNSANAGLNLYNLAGSYIGTLGSLLGTPTGVLPGCTAEVPGVPPTQYCQGTSWDNGTSFFSSNSNRSMGGTLIDPTRTYFYFFDPVNGQLVRMPMNQ